MDELVNMLADFVGLRFEQDPNQRNSKRTSRTNATSIFSLQQDLQKFGDPIWQWPAIRDSGPMHRSASMQIFVERSAQSTMNVVPAQALMELFFAQEWDLHKRIFGAGRLLKQFKAMKEILLAGDTNRLVAELTFVRINDLAAPPEPIHPLIYIEPLVALLIVCNGIMIGYQTDPEHEDWHGWTYVEIAFLSVLLIEIALRMHLLRCWKFWCGPDWLWNYFDIVLGLTGLVDISVQLVNQQKSDIFGTSLLRFCRLIRLVRIVKVFRLKFMRDLRLMVKGLVAGVRTLTLAFTLLFSVLYVIGGFATMAIGSDARTDAAELKPYFRNLPQCMFTAFRCYTGDCVNEKGEPITHLLAEIFGYPFIMSYVVSYMLVAMGIFNVILAVYVDITMKAAKENEAVTAEQYARESIRVARTTRELLKRFAAAYRLFHDLEDDHSEVSHLEISPGKTVFTDEDVHEGIAITKDLFLLVIQDRGVQQLMDELDLPPDRANLFEIIDADGSGTLRISELVQGLLKIRGEISKSDAIAALLATKAVYSMLEEIREETTKSLDDLKDLTLRSVSFLCTELPQHSFGASQNEFRELAPDIDVAPGWQHDSVKPDLLLPAGALPTSTDAADVQLRSC
ncbi:Cacna1c [Symbiodinium pilosum]|uniref:Cacna1c protein n=1 Tax=Symbiodinium pilosum TaxID=2952 RepID=A0A812U5J7_SYMPI|nr:Cacna1c [Symbiodinium pilosum]